MNVYSLDFWSLVDLEDKIEENLRGEERVLCSEELRKRTLLFFVQEAMEYRVRQNKNITKEVLDLYYNRVESIHKYYEATFFSDSIEKDLETYMEEI